LATATNSNWKLLLLGSISGSPLNCSPFHGPFWYTELPTTAMAPARANELAMFPEHGEEARQERLTVDRDLRGRTVQTIVANRA